MVLFEGFRVKVWVKGYVLEGGVSGAGEAQEAGQGERVGLRGGGWEGGERDGKGRHGELVMPQTEWKAANASSAAVWRPEGEGEM